MHPACSVQGYWLAAPLALKAQGGGEDVVCGLCSTSHNQHAKCIYCPHNCLFQSAVWSMAQHALLARTSSDELGGKVVPCTSSAHQ